MLNDDLIDRLERLRGEIQGASWPALVRALREAADRIRDLEARTAAAEDALASLPADAGLSDSRVCDWYEGTAPLIAEILDRRQPAARGAE